METPLAERRCTVCTPETPTLRADEIDKLLQQLSGWSVVQGEAHPLLTRSFRFKGFMPGVELINRIAPFAEAWGRSPGLHLSYGSLRGALWPHAAGGLAENDFVLAAKIAQIQPS